MQKCEGSIGGNEGVKEGRREDYVVSAWPKCITNEDRGRKNVHAFPFYWSIYWCCKADCSGQQALGLYLPPLVRIATTITCFVAVLKIYKTLLFITDSSSWEGCLIYKTSAARNRTDLGSISSSRVHICHLCFACWRLFQSLLLSLQNFFYILCFIVGTRKALLMYQQVVQTFSTSVPPLKSFL